MCRRRADIRVPCPICKKVIACVVPPGGDGSGFRPVHHKHNGCTCQGKYEIVDYFGQHLI